MSKTTKKSAKAETPNPNAPADAPSPTRGKGSHGDKRILSIAIDPALHSKLALLARCEGRSVTDLVVEAVSRNLKGRIATALEALKADLDK
jgi:hypothetical protein